VPVTFDYDDESDPGPYPVPPNPPIEGGPNSSGDRHILIVDIDNWKLYELFAAFPEGSGWRAGSGAIFDLSSNQLRPVSAGKSRRGTSVALSTDGPRPMRPVSRSWPAWSGGTRWSRE
jgi:hypothetical protein